MDGFFDCLNKDIPTSQKGFARVCYDRLEMDRQTDGIFKRAGFKVDSKFLCLYISFVHIHIILGSLGVILILYIF
jgi:hypothetical protein